MTLYFENFDRGNPVGNDVPLQGVLLISSRPREVNGDRNYVRPSLPYLRTKSVDQKALDSIAVGRTVYPGPRHKQTKMGKHKDTLVAPVPPQAYRDIPLANIDGGRGRTGMPDNVDSNEIHKVSMREIDAHEGAPVFSGTSDPSQ